VYPKQTPRDFDHLAWMAKFVDFIEINTSFYHLPAPAVVEGWAERARRIPRLTFAMKAWQGFTHPDPPPETNRGTPRPPAMTSGSLAEDAAIAAQRTVARILHDAGRLSALLLQFPYTHRYNRQALDKLEQLLEHFAGLPLSVEFRHRSWLGDDVFEVLGRHRAAFCNIDQPRLLDNLPPTSLATAPLRYMRMHGRNHQAWFARNTNVEQRYSYLYSEEELQPWAAQALELASGGPTLWAFNNHGQGQALANALMARAMTRELAGLNAEDHPVVAPDILADRYPVLRSLADLLPTRRPDEQLNLFD
jgi:uncharacterized protein YecE (DUF72 family)